MDSTKSVVTLAALAEELGLDRSALRKYVVKQGIRLQRVRTLGSRGQQQLALTPEDAETLRSRREDQGYVASVDGWNASGIGYFYVIQVVPELAPNRVKVGWSGDVQARLTAHQTSAPTAVLLKAWPCRQRWEATVIDSATRMECDHLRNEVFECKSLARLVERVDAFLALLPTPND